MRFASAIGTVAALSCVGVASAAFELLIDLNNVTIDAGGVIGDASTFTGSIVFSDNANSVLVDVVIDSTSGGPTASLFDFSGQVDLTNGAITGGFFRVELTDGTVYTNSVASGSLFVALGNVFGGGTSSLHDFNSNLFGGVGVTPWDNPTLEGTWLLNNFNQGATGRTEVGGVDLVIVVPTPGLAAFGLAGLGAGLRRRRR